MTPEDFIPSDEQNALKESFESLPSYSGLQTTFRNVLLSSVSLAAEDATNRMRERLPPRILINSHVTPQEDFYYGLRNLLTAFDVQVASGPGTDLVTSVINSLYVSIPAWKEEAEQLLQIYKNSVASLSTAPQTPATPPSNTSHVPYSRLQDSGTIMRNKSAAISAFKSESSRFSGTMGSKMSLHRFKQVYKTVMDEFSIPRANQVAMMHHALSGQARDHFFETIYSNAHNLGEAYEIMTRRFDTGHHRAQARAMMEQISISGIRAELSCSTATALDKAFERISDLAPMCGPDMCNDAHKSQYLAATVKSESWSQHVLTQRLTSLMSFQSLYTMLHAAVTQHILSTTAKLGTPSESESAPMAYATHYGGAYANGARPGSSRGSNSRPQRFPRRPRTPKELSDLKKRTRCMRCGEVGHWRAECPRRDLSMTDAIRARVVERGGNDRAIAEVLFTIVQDDDVYESFLSSDTLQPDDRIERNAFDSYISSLQDDGTNDELKNSFDLLCDSLTNLNSSPKEDNSNSTEPDSTPSAINYLSTNGACETEYPIYNVPCTLENLRERLSQSHCPQRFEGALIDTGAQRSVIGLLQARSYMRHFKIHQNLAVSRARFRFGSVVTTSLGLIEICLRTPGGLLPIKVDVVPDDIPFLLGLDMLDLHSLQLLNVTNELQCVAGNWKAPVTRKRGHAFYTWDTNTSCSTFFTRQDIERIHKHLAHPSSQKLYDLLRRATDNKIPEGTRKLLESVIANCNTCNLFSTRPLVFRVRDIDKVIFNHRLLIDIMYLPAGNRKQTAVLHIIDAGTKFNSAVFLPAVNVATVWNAFIKAWSCMYVGMPASMLVDQGSVFMSDEWKNACEVNSIELSYTGTESHNSLGAGETYHAFLRRIYSKLRHDFPQLEADVLLAMSVKALNDCAGPHGLVPSLLVFGVLPRVPNLAKRDHPSQLQRIRAAIAARHEYERIVSQQRIKLALNKRPPQAASHSYAPGDFAYVFREKLRHFTGPHMLASCSGKAIRLHVGDSTGPRLFNTSQVRPAPLPNAIEDGAKEPPYSSMILHTEIIHPGDPRQAQFTKAKRSELAGLLERGAFRVVLREDIGAKPNIIPSRFVLAIKHSDTGESKLKARLVVGGHRDKEKQRMLHNSCTLSAGYLRLLLTLATILGYDLWSVDMKQGYLQSGSTLQRKIYTRPDSLDLKPNELVQLLRPIYGLCDSGEYWFETLTNYHREHLSFEQSTGDFSLFFRRMAARLVCMSGTYVDDILQAGTPNEKERTIALLKRRFDIEITEGDSISYVGLQIDNSDRNIRKLKQTNYIERLQLLGTNSTFAEFRSQRARIAWMVQTRPDIACAVSFAAQVTEDSFDLTSIKALNALVKHLRKTPHIALQFPKLDLHSLRLAAYVDSSFCNCKGGLSQLGYIICIADKTNRCAILQFASKKSRRITRSTTTGEAFAFVDGFDTAFLLKHDLQRIIGTKIPIVMLTDSEILFNIITRNKQTSEKRLMIDIRATREAYNNREISNIALIASEDNPADAMTKVGANNALTKLLSTFRLDHPIKQYIIETVTASGAKA